MYVRQMVKIREIDEIRPMENVEEFEVAVIGGWTSVIRKDSNFKVGDKVLYLEIDSFLPKGNIDWDHLMKRGLTKVTLPTGEEVEGHVLRTMKIRGHISQGLVLPFNYGLTEESSQEEIEEKFSELGVLKVNRPVPMAGRPIGVFSSNVKFPTMERVQNLTDEFLSSLDPEEWVATELIDGVPATYIKENGRLRCFDNYYELDETSLQYNVAMGMRIGPDRKNLEEHLPEGVLIQGEIFGPNIYNNPLSVDSLGFAVHGSAGAAENEGALEFVKKNKVPELSLKLPKTIEEALSQSDRMMSKVNPLRQAEGIVWVHKGNKKFDELREMPRFKVINNSYLLENDDWVV